MFFRKAFIPVSAAALSLNTLQWTMRRQCKMCKIPLFCFALPIYCSCFTPFHMCTIKHRVHFAPKSFLFQATCLTRAWFALSTLPPPPGILETSVCVGIFPACRLTCLSPSRSRPISNVCQADPPVQSLFLIVSYRKGRQIKGIQRRGHKARAKPTVQWLAVMHQLVERNLNGPCHFYLLMVPPIKTSINHNCMLGFHFTQCSLVQNGV